MVTSGEARGRASACWPLASATCVPVIKAIATGASVAPSRSLKIILCLRRILVMQVAASSIGEQCGARPSTKPVQRIRPHRLRQDVNRAVSAALQMQAGSERRWTTRTRFGARLVGSINRERPRQRCGQGGWLQTPSFAFAAACDVQQSREPARRERVGLVARASARSKARSCSGDQMPAENVHISGGWGTAASSTPARRRHTTRPPRPGTRTCRTPICPGGRRIRPDPPRAKW